MSDPNSVSAAGFDAAGFRIYVSLGIAPDADADAIVDIVRGLQYILKEAGLTPREVGLEKGEQTRDIRYILRRDQYNDDNTVTPILDLYSGNFRWVGTWLDDENDVKAFETATGLKLDKLPVSASQIKEYTPRNPNVANLFTVLNPPVQIVYKDNPKWSDSLSEEDKKKVSKRQFVRWAGVSNQTGQTDDQTDSRQTGRQTTQTARGGVSNQTDSRQTGRQSSSKQTGGQTDGRQTADPFGEGTAVRPRRQNRIPPPSSQDNGTTRIEVLNQVYRKKVNDKNWLTTTPTNAGTWTRKPFADQGITIEKEFTGIVDLGGFYNVISVRNEDGYYYIDRLEPIGEAEHEIFHEGQVAQTGQQPQQNDPFGAPPEFEDDEKF